VAQRPVHVRAKDVKQGKTLWMVEVIVPPVPAPHLVEAQIQKFPGAPAHWYSDDEWGRSRIKPPRRFFVTHPHFLRATWKMLPPLTYFFFRQKDAQAYYDLLAEVVLAKRAKLESRFPKAFNLVQLWPVNAEQIELAQVKLDTELVGNRLNLKP
jgi:hypothetical protein